MEMIELKQVSHGDARVEYGNGEKPRYRAIARAINAFYRDLLRPVEALQQRLETILGLTVIEKAAAFMLNFKSFKEFPFDFNRARQRQVDAAIDDLLEALVGPDRTEAGFVKGGIQSDATDGIIQLHNLLSFAIGLQRGSDLVNQPQTLVAARNNPATEKMLENAFARLSTGGQLRLEGVRDEIHAILAGASQAGLNPLETARQLSKQFDDYKGWEFQRLARTEAAFASEEGVRGQLEEYGVTHYTWLISDGACPICQGYVGQIIPADDTENLPPAHPQCLCSVAPAGIGEMLL